MQVALRCLALRCDLLCPNPLPSSASFNTVGVRPAPRAAYVNGQAFDPREWKAMNDSSGNWTKELVPINVANQTVIRDWCAGGLNLSLAWRNNMTGSVQRLLVDLRLGDQRVTGKIAQRNAVNTNLRNYLTANYPELVTPIYTTPTGTVPLQDPLNSRLDYLFPLYVEGIRYGVTEPAYASINMTRRVVYNTSVHMLDLAPRARARIAELKGQQDDVASFVIQAPLATYKNLTFANVTVGQLYSTFLAAGATNATIPKPDNATLGMFAIPYNLVAWQGNTTAYMRCDLDDRGKEFVGECVAMNVSCVSTLNDTVPYNCTYLADQTPVPGSLSNVTYRRDCETHCDRRLDCNTLCECYNTCSATEYCECPACVALHENAADDDQFVSIRSVATDQAAAEASIARLGLGDLPSRRRATSRRSLQQTTNDELSAQLSNVLTQVGTVSTQQSTIKNQMDALAAQVSRANQLAEARANDNRLMELIAAGRADIQTGQAKMMGMLDEIIGKQNQALAAAEEAAKSLSAIQVGGRVVCGSG